MSVSGWEERRKCVSAMESKDLSPRDTALHFRRPATPGVSTFPPGILLYLLWGPPQLLLLPPQLLVILHLLVD